MYPNYLFFITCRNMINSQHILVKNHGNYNLQHKIVKEEKKCRQAKDLNIAAIAYTPLASIILMAYNAYSAQSKTWKKE